jgi:hypothetical protein
MNGVLYSIFRVSQVALKNPTSPENMNHEYAEHRFVSY